MSDELRLVNKLKWVDLGGEINQLMSIFVEAPAIVLPPPTHMSQSAPCLPYSSRIDIQTSQQLA